MSLGTSGKLAFCRDGKPIYGAGEWWVLQLAPQSRARDAGSRKVAMHVLFHAEQLALRGTETAVFDYARYNEEVLGNRSTIVYQRTSPRNIPAVVERFAARFALAGYDGFGEIDAIAERERADLFYILKSGKNDGRVVRSCPTAVHAVFAKSPRQRHGDRYAFVSEYLSQKCSGGRIPFVPHMVDLPAVDDDLRAELGIPADATVLGGYGGNECFDIPFVHKAVARTLENRSDLWFLFMNFNRFINHERAIFLPGNSDRAFKAKFINTCDAMLYARTDGETFGLACGEFSIRNRPIMAYAFSKEKCHIDILGSKGLIYRNQRDLETMVLGFSREQARAGDWDCYSRRFNPKSVMEIFEREFILGGAAVPQPAHGWRGLFNLWG
ncbi:MAG: hypothetical protein P4L98_09865 [Ancalomicrobiaceae bacterium]|nr:hypothetical protein [Ancalomicrobiaceae bacterium]